jgi:hypothetical protein
LLLRLSSGRAGYEENDSSDPFCAFSAHVHMWRGQQASPASGQR